MRTTGGARPSRTRLDAEPSAEGWEEYQRGCRDGMAWAREYATPDELRDLVANFEPGQGGGFGAGHSLHEFLGGSEHPDAAGVAHSDSPFWRGFAAGAEEVLDSIGG